MLKELIENEKKYLDFFFDNLNLSALEEIFEVLKNCKGVIILTGVGKSGLIAKKIAATMTSTNTRAVFLSPMNAVHGDLGIVTDKDVFVFLSKSGESEELLNLIPSLRNKGVKLVAVVSNPKSHLVEACDHVMVLPVKRELCPYDMAPTTSTTVQMIFGDIMAVALMRLRNFSLDDFALNHPAGSIGKRITLKVKDLMLKGEKIPTCPPSASLVDILVELSNKQCGCVLVVDDQKKLMGIFTDGDLRRSLQKKGPSALSETMETLMTRNPRQIDPEDLATKAIKTMETGLKNEITVLPVLDSERHVVGLIKLHDIIQTGI